MSKQNNPQQAHESQQYVYNGSAIRLDNRKLVTLVALNEFNRVMRASGVSCVWSGTLALSHLVLSASIACRIIADGGEAYYEANPDADRAAA
jgi:hypothetical protein